MKINKLIPEYHDNIPEELQNGILYISKKYGCTIHLCACGCGKKTVCSLKPEWDNGWSISEVSGLVTLRPSIGNFAGENPYHAHYYITENRIEWL